jgi:endonuclease/exonuclease/phosphatase family metal-dependent hydrolase
VTLVAATYNIHGCVGMDRREDHHRIVKVLHGLGADVIALQEVDNYPHEGSWRQHLQLFAEEMGMASVAGPTMKKHRGEYGNAILTRLPIRSHRTIEIGVAGREPRGVIEADLIAEGRPVRVIATHLGLGAEERRIQVETIRELVAEAGSDLVIVMGDFNEWRSGGVRALERALGTGTRVRSFPAIFPVLPLDRIWVRPAHRVRALEAVTGHGARLASDHLPVRAVIEL